ncbi:MAG: ATP-binding cassette domain-containing protein, partial [Mailhella sp.]
MASDFSAPPILDVHELRVSFTSENAVVNAVRGISFQVYPQEFFSLVGESGSGKSVTVMTAMGLLDANGFLEGGHIDYMGKRLLDASLPRHRWKKPDDMAMIFQYPLVALNPIRSIGLQLKDVLET